jgi:hypothetical protein
MRFFTPEPSRFALDNLDSLQPFVEKKHLRNSRFFLEIGSGNWPAYLTPFTGYSDQPPTAVHPSIEAGKQQGRAVPESAL